MVPVLTADLAAQRALLRLAATDHEADAAAHERVALPENAVIADGATRSAELREKVALAEVEVGDIDAAARKLDGEIESVRARAARDQELLASGAASPKEMENLQREIESLSRRQSTLEDDALELMEQREVTDGGLASVRDQLAAIDGEIRDATVRRDAAWSGLDAEIGRLTIQRAALAAEIPADAVAVYERLRAAGKVAAATLAGDRCGGCGMALDRASLEEIRSAAETAVPRCPECGTLLIRNP